MPPNILQVHTEYAFVNSVGPKVLWTVAVETTGVGGWRIFLSPPVPCLNFGWGDSWPRNLNRIEVQPDSGSGNLHILLLESTQQQHHS
ncbi:hypothetical protein TNCV_3959821 [Trichonephila clavipes]|nr:hypothetical protein TNCV_3959821 [Trichonephila clavipes]